MVFEVQISGKKVNSRFVDLKLVSSECVDLELKVCEIRIF